MGHLIFFIMLFLLILFTYPQYLWVFPVTIIYVVSCWFWDIIHS